jgi:hypothetical protein
VITAILPFSSNSGSIASSKYPQPSPNFLRVTQESPAASSCLGDLVTLP